MAFPKNTVTLSWKINSLLLYMYMLQTSWNLSWVEYNFFFRYYIFILISLFSSSKSVCFFFLNSKSLNQMYLLSERQVLHNVEIRTEVFQGKGYHNRASSLCYWALWMVAFRWGSSLTARMGLQRSFNTYLCVKVEACDTKEWVPHGRDTQEQVLNMKGID